ncbi:hypothetical protein [Pseudoneobacillus sp. C159]
MSIFLLQWGLFSFMLGIILSLPLAAVHYQKNRVVAKIIVNYKKLKSAHTDFFMQAFAAGFVYLLEFALKMEFPLWVTAPLIFGIVMNPKILLLEATPFIRAGWFKTVYKILRGISPTSLLLAWGAIAYLCLPIYLTIGLVAVSIICVIVFFYFKNKQEIPIRNSYISK